MSRKHNQMIRRKTKEYGHSTMDWQDKHEVVCALPEYKCLVDYFLVGWDDGRYETRATIYTDWLERTKPLIIRHPDIVACRNDRSVVIEIDGAVHKGDAKRNSDYEVLGIPYLILNKADLKARHMTLAEAAVKGVSELYLHEQ